MVYNPVLQVWEGNESVLSDFEKTLSALSTPTAATHTPTRPVLMQHIPSGKQPERVGDMVFDPEKMCWIGNEEEADIFADIDFGTCANEPEAVTTAFVLSKAAKESLYISEASHKLFMGQWYPRVVQDSRMVMRDMSKTHLYEIRSILESF
eukprot:jgi/Hompol1/6706/HPOL_001637-RA